MKSLFRIFVARGVSKKGLRGGSSFWLVVGAFQLIARWYGKHGKRVETTTLTERLRPGDELTLRYPGKPGRKTRREVAADQQRRHALEDAHRREVARLQMIHERGGRRGRKAAKALEALRETAPK